MKRIGYILITLGFLVASWMAVQHPTEIAFGQFVPAAAFGLLGVILARVGARQEAEHADTVQANIGDIVSSIDRVVENVTMLNREKETIHTYDMRFKIDELLVPDLNIFADARETIGTKYGLDEYAEIMSHFAAGERYLNRVWSCSADGYIDEVNEYIGRAEEQFLAVQARIRELRAERP